MLLIIGDGFLQIDDLLPQVGDEVLPLGVFLPKSDDLSFKGPKVPLQLHEPVENIEALPAANGNPVRASLLNVNLPSSALGLSFIEALPIKLSSSS